MLYENPNKSYYQLVSIFTPLASSNPNNYPQPSNRHHFKPGGIKHICEQDVDILPQPSHQVPCPDIPLFLHLAKLEQQQALEKEDKTIGNHDKTSSTGDDKESDEEPVSFENDACDPESPCHSIMQVVLSEIEEILSVEDDERVGSIRPESFSESVDEEEDLVK